MMNHSTHANDKNMNDSQGLRFTSTGNTHSRTGAYSSAILSYLWISTWIKPLPFFNFWTCWCLIEFLLAFPSPTHQPTRRTIRESPHPGRNQSQSRRPDIEGCSPDHPKDFQCGSNMKQHEAMKRCTDYWRIHWYTFNFYPGKFWRRSIRIYEKRLESLPAKMDDFEGLSHWLLHNLPNTTVDGQNPAQVDVVNLSLVACTTTVVKPSHLFQWILFINGMVTFFKLHISSPWWFGWDAWKIRFLVVPFWQKEQIFPIESWPRAPAWPWECCWFMILRIYVGNNETNMMTWWPYELVCKALRLAKQLLWL